MQQKLLSIKNTDPTLWQTYKLTRTFKTKYPILQDTSHNTTLYTDNEKAEGLAQMFEQIHLKAFHTHFPIQQEIESQASLITEKGETQKSFISFSPGEVKKFIKKLPNNKAPGPDKILAKMLKNLPNKLIVQIYYIYKACSISIISQPAGKQPKLFLLSNPGNQQPPLPTTDQSVS